MTSTQTSMVWVVSRLSVHSHTKFTMRGDPTVDSIHIYALMESETASIITPAMKAMMT
jgi:hypothetical protein